ncbi:MAG: immunoglobulin domain-containing protein [Opitutaceae bacterium]|nr:immunoglobulin domain-containing protein [Opitutaceae bacterium]
MKSRLLLPLLFFITLLSPASAWVRSSPEAAWPVGAVVTMQLRLGTSPPLIDGRTWDANAIEAMQIWNGCMHDLQLAWQTTGTTTAPEHNQLNDLLFADNIYGEAWGANVLAVTITWSSGTTRTESDILFTTSRQWNAYRGSLRYPDGYGYPTSEFRRVAMHELGHVLELGHPDENEQWLSALMNSAMSDLDTLAEDDKDGIGTLYGRGPDNQILPPQIDPHPFSQECYAGESFSFTIGASGRGLSYQWQKDGVDLPGAIDRDYSKSASTLADAGSYTVVVSNEGGRATSNPAQLVVLPVPPPVFTSPLYNALAVQGDRLYLYCWVDGRNVTYQWSKDGAPIAGATYSSFELRAATLGDAGVYTVVASNAGGSVVSTPATVTVIPAVPPRINYGPRNATAVLGGSVSYGVDVSGSQPLTYQWYRDGLAIRGATWSWLDIRALTEANEGSYSVKVTNAGGSVTSAAVQLHLVAPPLDRNLVANGGEVRLGGRFDLGASFDDTGVPCTFQWYHNGVPIAADSWGRYSIVNAMIADSGEYLLTRTNSSGTVSSTPGLVSVVSCVDPSFEGETPASGTWVDIQAHAGVVYVLYATPGRIERYDMSARKWLPPVMLPATASAFLVDAAGVHVAFGTKISRFALDLTGETTVAQASQECRQLVRWSGRLYSITAVANPKLEVFDEQTGVRIASANGPWGMPAAVSLAPTLARLYAGTAGYFPLATDGTVGAYTELSRLWDVPVGRRCFLSPDAALISDGGGILYRTSDFQWAAALGGGFQDIVFLPGGGAAVLRGNRVQRLDAAWREFAEAKIDVAGDRMFSFGGEILAFAQTTTPGGAIGVARVGPDDMQPRPSAAPIDASGLHYAPDDVLVDRAGNVLLVSRVHRNVFRWSTAERRYLAPVTLPSTPSYVAYSEIDDALILAQPTGSIVRKALSDGASVQCGATFSAPTGLVVAGAVVLAVDASGSYHLRPRWHRSLGVGVSHRISCLRLSATNRRVYCLATTRRQTTFASRI